MTTREELRELADAATSGPWRAQDGLCTIHDGFVARIGYTGVWASKDGDPRKDAAFIAAARTAVPALLDALEEALAERDHWKANHDEQVAKKRRLSDMYAGLHRAHFAHWGHTIRDGEHGVLFCMVCDRDFTRDEDAYWKRLTDAGDRLAASFGVPEETHSD